MSGPALFLGLADLVAMTGDAFAYVSGPDAVAGWSGLHLTARELGGAAVHGRTTGVATFVTGTEAEALATLDHALAYLPDHNGDEPPTVAGQRRPATGRPPSCGTCCPPRPTAATTSAA